MVEDPTSSDRAEAPRIPCHGVLVIDDDDAIRDTVKLALENEGYQVTAATNGSDALAALRRTDPLPCVILLDLMMPVMDGWQFREEQTKDPALAAIPVVVITADSRAGAKAAALKADGALPKPLRLTDLLDTVALYCS